MGSPLSHPHPSLKLLRSSLTRSPSRSSLWSPRSLPVPFPSLFLTHTVHSDNRPGALHPYSLPDFFFWLWIYTHSASRMCLCLSVLQTPQTLHPLSKLLPVPCRFGPLIVLNSVDFSPSQRPGLIPQCLPLIESASASYHNKKYPYKSQKNRIPRLHCKSL